MTMYEHEDVRAAAVQAAAAILGSQGYWRRDIPGGGVEYQPSPPLKELTDRICGFITDGEWERGRHEG